MQGLLLEAPWSDRPIRRIIVAFPIPDPSIKFPPMAAGKRKKKVETVFLVCEETGDYNYTIRRKTGGEKLKLQKYSPRLRKHTTHTEKKK